VEKQEYSGNATGKTQEFRAEHMQSAASQGLQDAITWHNFHADGKRQHTPGTKNLISTEFQTLTKYSSKRRP